MIAPARAAAYTALRAVTSGRATLPDAIARSRASLSDERDRALAAEIVIGALRWQAALDARISQLANRPLQRLDAEIVDVLRLSAYQLLYLDRIPARAVVDDAVKLARKAGKQSAAGFVNAVLRALASERTDRDEHGQAGSAVEVEPGAAAPPAKAQEGPSDRDALLDGLSTRLSHPRWLVARWVERFGVDGAIRWMEFNNSPAPITLRANRLKTTRDDLAEQLRAHGIVTEPGRYAPHALLVREGNPLAAPLASTGLFVVQDEASQLVTELAAARPGEFVLDACASPGGKTTSMAADMKDDGMLVATDLRGARLDLLRRTVASSGATCVRLLQNDLRSGLPFAPRFDLVLVDAPCSGVGTLRRDPDIKWRRREEALPVFRDTELTILETAAAGVRPGGRLVYATCSSEPEENDEVVRTFLAGHPEFAPFDPRSGPDPLVEGLADVLDDSGRLRTAAHLHGLEAFFAAVLVRS